MSVTPTGFLSVTADALARAIANSSTFQTVTGSANATEAATHIFHERAFDNVAAQVPPRAIVAFDNVEDTQDGGIGTSGTLVAVIEIPVGSSYLQSGTQILDKTKWNDAWMDFSNKVGAIWREVSVLIKSGGYLSATGSSSRAYGLQSVGQDTSDRDDESGNTLAGKDVFFWEVGFPWRGG